MTIAYWTVLVAAILPIVFAGVAKGGGERYNNRAPREWLDRQAGWRRRAHWAQQNSYEAFTPFAAGVIIAHQLGAAQGTINALALTFIALRIIYGICYIGDWHLLRSLSWVGGFLCIIGLFIAAA